MFCLRVKKVKSMTKRNWPTHTENDLGTFTVKKVLSEFEVFLALKTLVEIKYSYLYLSNSSSSIVIELAAYHKTLKFLIFQKCLFYNYVSKPCAG